MSDASAAGVPPTRSLAVGLLAAVLVARGGSGTLITWLGEPAGVSARAASALHAATATAASSSPVPAVAAALQAIEVLVETATGPEGLVVVFVYSVLVAAVLPLPAELVLLPAPTMELGLSTPASVGVVVLVSAAGKALGSVLALRIGRGAVNARPSRWLRDRAFPGAGRAASDGRLTRFVRRYGYLGMAIVLAVPLVPDTAVVYAFAVVDADERWFAVAAFLGTVGRLLVTLALAVGVLSVT